VEACLPLFEALGHPVRVGDQPHLANVVKLCGNFLIAAQIETLGEALALAGKAGIEGPRFLDLLTSTLFNSPVFKNYGSMIVERRFEPAGFAAALGEKDLRLLLAAAQSFQAPLPVASLIHDRFLTLLAQGGEQLDWAALGALAARDAGRPL
jgi:3-hydroxyisobutyrate dehydrogenase-like beta-hydroxyacid dehydrogenase